MSTRPSTISLSFLLILLCPLLQAQSCQQTTTTTFEFRTPTGKTSPPVRSSTVVVPGIDVFATLDEYEAAVVPAIRDALIALPEVRSIQSFTYSLPVPTVRISGEQTTIVGELSGLERIDIFFRFRSGEGWIRTFCGDSLPAEAHFTDLSARILYDFFTGDPLDVEIAYAGVDADFSCTVPLIGDFLELLNDLFNVVDPVEEAIAALQGLEGFAEESLNGRYANLFSLEDVLIGFQESGPQDIREFSDDAMRLLGGLSSAIAAFIADEITEELINRLSLQTEAEIDQLRDQLSGLEEFIADNIPGLTGMPVGQLNGLDLSDYLTPRLPGIQTFLLDRLSAYYANAVAAVNNLETLAIDAVEQFVGADWSRLFGGVNVKLVLNRAASRVTLDAYHTAPASFIGRSEAVAPCFPNYTAAETENASSYSVYNGAGTRLYKGPLRYYTSAGLLRGVTVENYFGLHSYPTYGEIQLYGWGDYAGNPDDFVWPQCPVPTSVGAHSNGPFGGGGTGGSGGSSGSGGSGGSGGPPFEEPPCGPGTGVICP